MNIVYNNTDFIELPPLPPDTKILECNNNKNLISLPDLPNNIQQLKCSNNKKLNSLPENLQNIWLLKCNNNNLSSLPVLPNSIRDLNCSNNLLKTLPPFRSNFEHDIELKSLDCNNNPLESLPNMPPFLSYLKISVFQVLLLNENNINPNITLITIVDENEYYENITQDIEDKYRKIHEKLKELLVDFENHVKLECKNYKNIMEKLFKISFLEKKPLSILSRFPDDIVGKIKSYGGKRMRTKKQNSKNSRKHKKRTYRNRK